MMCDKLLPEPVLSKICTAIWCHSSLNKGDLGGKLRYNEILVQIYDNI